MTIGEIFNLEENNLYISVDAKKKKKKQEDEEEIEDSENEKEQNPDLNDDFYKLDFVEAKSETKQNAVPEVRIIAN